MIDLGLYLLTTTLDVLFIPRRSGSFRACASAMTGFRTEALVAVQIKMVSLVLEGIKPDKTSAECDFASGFSVEAGYKPATSPGRIKAAYGFQTFSHCRDTDLSENFLFVLRNLTYLIVHMLANSANTRRVSARCAWYC